MATRTASQVKTKTATIDGLSIRYAESAPREVSAILLSPWPESLYTFEQMWSRLAEHAHLVAIDLPGFGHSERNDDLLKSSAMAEFVVRAINEFGLNCPHAVGPISARRRCCLPPRSTLTFSGASSSATVLPQYQFKSAVFSTTFWERLTSRRVARSIHDKGSIRFSHSSSDTSSPSMYGRIS